MPRVIRPSRSASTGCGGRFIDRSSSSRPAIEARTGNRAFGDERALPHPRFGEAALARFSIGARHRRKVDAERLRQRAVRRQLLPPSQAPAGDVSRQGVDDLQVERAGPHRPM